MPFICTSDFFPRILKSVLLSDNSCSHKQMWRNYHAPSRGLTCKLPAATSIFMHPNATCLRIFSRTKKHERISENDLEKIINPKPKKKKTKVRFVQSHTTHTHITHLRRQVLGGGRKNRARDQRNFLSPKSFKQQSKIKT